MRSTTIYRNQGGKVVKQELVRNVMGGDGLAHDFHANIIRTYALLEERGDLREMSARTKGKLRDLHTLAQDSRYWD